MVIDILILIIFAFTLYRGWKRGLIYNVGVVFLLLIAFYLASALSGVVAERVYEQALAKGSLVSIEEKISDDLNQGQSVDGALDNLGLPEAYKKIIKDDTEGLIPGMLDIVEQIGAESRRQVDRVASELTKSLIIMTIKIIVFMLIFFLSYFILKAILGLISRGLNKLPLIGTLNRSLGLLVAFMLAVFISGTVISLLPGLQTYFPAMEKMLGESRLASFIIDSPLYYSILDTIF